jgi:Carboxypeptidase regulatory-like domain/TonB dependent receptor
LFLLATVCASLHAQAVIGSSTVHGTVTDYTGSGIPDTTIIISNDRLGVHRELDTTDDGGFNASALTPGAGYNLKATRKGFLDLDQNNFELLAGHTLSFTIRMAQEPALARNGEKQPSSIHYEDQIFAALESTVSTTELENLPSAERAYNSLVPLAPSAPRNEQTGIIGFRSEGGTNADYVDGILTTNLFFYSQPQITPAVPQDALTEMQVISAEAPSEFGHAYGGYINAVTPGGGNALHGSVFGYYSPNSWDAADRFAPAFHPTGSQTQTGANVGGPATSEKTFWFVNVEDLVRHTQELNRAVNPLITNPEGTAVNTANCAAPATTAQCAAATNFLNQQLNRVVNSTLDSLWGLAKFEWRPNSFNAVNFEAGVVHQLAPNGTDMETVSVTNGLLGQNGSWSDDTEFGKAGYTAVFSGNVTNQVYGALYHNRFSDYEDPSLLPTTGRLGIDIAGTPFGGNPNLPMYLSENRVQAVDNLSASLGAHSLKVGVDFSFDTDYNRQIINSEGDYSYPTLTSFAQDYTGNSVSRKDYTQLFQGFGVPVVDLQTKIANVYLQDTWTPLKNVSVVMGLTWEKPFLPKPPDENSTFFQTGSITVPDIDFAPRVGVAYQWDDRTVFRAGIGTYYQPYSGQLLETLYNGNAINQLQAVITPLLESPPVFPHILGSPFSVPEGSDSVVFERSKLRLPVSAQGTIGVERRLTNSATVSVSYLYVRGIDLLAFYDTNLNFPTFSDTYIVDNSAGRQVTTLAVPQYTTRTNTDFSRVNELENDGTSTYSAGIAEFRQRFSHGLSLQANYVWSHAIDDVSGPPTLAGFIPSNFAPGYYQWDRQNSTFNQPQRATILFTWQPTPMHNDSFAARYLINGWTLAGAVTLASGLEETPLIAVEGQQFGSTTMVYPTSINGSGGWSRVPTNLIPIQNGVSAPKLGVPAMLPTGAEYNADLRLARAIPLTERVHASFMFDAFNAFNTQYTTAVNQIEYTAISGVLRPLASVGTPIAANGFPWGDNARHLEIALKIVF